MGSEWQTVELSDAEDAGGTQKTQDSFSPEIVAPTALRQRKRRYEPILLPPERGELQEPRNITTDTSRSGQTVRESTPEPHKASVPPGPPEHNGPPPDSPEIRNMLQLAIRTDLCDTPSATIPDMPEDGSSLASHPESRTSHAALQGDDEVVPDSAIHTGSPMLRSRRRSAKSLHTLIEKRMAILGLRAEVRDARTNLTYRREKLRNRDALLLQELQKTDALNVVSQNAILLDLCQSVQADRESFLELENEYNEFEISLDRDEWELKLLETKVYDLLKTAKDVELASVTRSISLPSASSDYSAPQTSIPIAPDYQTVLETRYLSRRGDIDILEEELQVLRAKRAHFVEEEQLRQRLGVLLNEEGRDFLDTFDEKHNEIQEDLRRARADWFDLIDDMLAHDDHLFGASQFGDIAVEAPDTSKDELLSDATIELRHPLNDHAMLADELKDVKIETLRSLVDRAAQTPKFSDVGKDVSTIVVNIPSFINEWLLHILRQSVLQVLYFRNYLTNLDTALSAQQLTKLVLDHWTEDGTARVSRLVKEANFEDLSVLSQSGVALDTTRTVQSDSAINRKDRLRLRFRGVPNPKENVPASLMFSTISRVYAVARKHDSV